MGTAEPATPAVPAMTSAPAVEIAGVAFGYRSGPVLEDLDLTIARDDYLALLGPNGGGKTTLLRLILGLLEPSCGTIRVLGASPRRARGRIGYVPQQAGFDLGFPIEVLDVVSMGRLGRRRGPRYGGDDRAAARAALAKVELTDLERRPIGALSGGQLQRVLIARALAVGPRLLLLDEPTASLDERIGRSLWELLGELSREMAVVIVSHDVGAISEQVRTVACLNRRLHRHPSGKLTPEVVEAAYGCPVELLVHGHQPHRHLGSHAGGDEQGERAGERER